MCSVGTTSVCFGYISHIPYELTNNFIRSLNSIVFIQFNSYKYILESIQYNNKTNIWNGIGRRLPRSQRAGRTELTYINLMIC